MYLIYDIEYIINIYLIYIFNIYIFELLSIYMFAYHGFLELFKKLKDIYIYM